jgi:hypothetical protein
VAPDYNRLRNATGGSDGGRTGHPHTEPDMLALLSLVMCTACEGSSLRLGCARRSANTATCIDGCVGRYMRR